MSDNKIRKRDTLRIGEILKLQIRHSGQAASFNTYKIFSAWDKVSGAGDYTLRRFFRGGTLYITVDSSVVRSQLRLQSDILLEKINAELRADNMFIWEDSRVGEVKQLIIK